MPARRYAELRNSRDEKHSYFMALGKGDVIDASRYGGLTRFLNHSCAPNCEAESWMVNGEMRVAIAALRDVAKDEEITFDYSWSSGDARTAAQPSKVSSDRRCRCGAPNCRGVLGDREEIVLSQALAAAPPAVAGGPRKRPARSVPEGKALEPATRAVVRAGFCREDGDAVERAVDAWWRRRDAVASAPSAAAPRPPGAAAASFAAFLALDDAGREALEPRPDEPEWTKRLLAARGEAAATPAARAPPAQRRGPRRRRRSSTTATSTTTTRPWPPRPRPRRPTATTARAGEANDGVAPGTEVGRAARAPADDEAPRFEAEDDEAAPSSRPRTTRRRRPPRRRRRRPRSAPPAGARRRLATRGARFDRQRTLYPGVVAKVHGDGTYDIAYDDGDEDSRLEEAYARSPGEAPRPEGARSGAAEEGRARTRRPRRRRAPRAPEAAAERGPDAPPPPRPRDEPPFGRGDDRRPPPRDAGPPPRPRDAPPFGRGGDRPPPPRAPPPRRARRRRRPPPAAARAPPPRPRDYDRRFDDRFREPSPPGAPVAEPAAPGRPSPPRRRPPSPPPRRRPPSPPPRRRDYSPDRRSPPRGYRPRSPEPRPRVYQRARL
ncbi:ASH1-like histone lysine methyltransferase [Aureococcus anophagefferens]|uniref:ASH1-like histone lysine methyltransferase n=1 Tax=Aureococcus anophagefferens TaxID=44056 RepID=A0ABR1FHT7_AURAN